jgi:hypothetical protein
MDDKLMKYIDTMSVKLGVAAQHLYEVLTRQSIVEGITYLILYPVLFAISLIGLIYSLKFYRKFDNERRFDEEYMAIAAACIFGILTAIMFIALIIEVPEAIGQLVNPEYYAIQHLLDAIK